MSRRTKPARTDLKDAQRLGAELKAVFAAHAAAHRPGARQVLAEALAQARVGASDRLARGDDGLTIARQLAASVDEIVRALFDFSAAAVHPGRGEGGGRITLVGVGGYGRGELAPFSDLDLLFLHDPSARTRAAEITEYVLYMLWDLGLKVGHATRTIDECIKLARSDHTIQTALLESRGIAGDEGLAAELATRFRAEVAERDHAGFIAAKLRERDERHAKSGASRYMVEPNIKEGKGGLRDLHTLFWMARHRYGFSRPRDYVEAGVLSQTEASAFRRALKFLWTVRCHLHFVVGRAEERLTFDVQPELAQRLGFVERGGYSAVERFMRRYFLVAKEVGMLTRVLCAQLEADHAKRAPRGLNRLLPAGRTPRAAPAPGFHVEAGRLNIDSPRVLETPANIIRLFEIAERQDLDVHPAALGAAARRVRRLAPAWRKDPEARAAFLDIVASPRHPSAALRLMNEADVLGRFIPEFGRIVGQMQFNMYHHYTVDEHTLQAVDAMSEVERGRHQAEHPLATEIFPKIINRRALYLAMLLHDTGKGDGDQQVEGEKSARAACVRLGLPPDEVDLVGWLVRHHLVMNDFAQKRDIGDPRTVAQFAAIVGTVERLRLLLVLTVADIRAVGPSLWNSWKGQLLRDLYRLTEATLHGGRSNEDGVRAHLSELAEAAKQHLRQDNSLANRSDLAAWLGSLEDGYWLNHDAEALGWHAREVLEARRTRDIPHVATRVRAAQGVTEVLIYAADRPGLFASLAAAISASGGDIAGARVHTTSDGAAFDVFSVQAGEHRPYGQDHAGTLAALVARLERAALENEATPTPAPLSRRASAFRIEPWVRIDNEITPASTVIEASGRDRRGLLAQLAHVCAEAGVSIVSAHIETCGERASDVFYVQGPIGGQIESTRRLMALRARLEEVLRAAEPATPADPAEKPLAVARSSTAR